MDERIDLSALELDDERREWLAAAVMRTAAAELARRASADVSPMLVLSRWLRPALAAAAVLAVLSAGVLTRYAVPAGGEPGPGLAAALEVPAPADAWLVGERSPTVTDLLIAMESEETAW